MKCLCDAYITAYTSPAKSCHDFLSSPKTTDDTPEYRLI